MLEHTPVLMGRQPALHAFLDFLPVYLVSHFVLRVRLVHFRQGLEKQGVTPVWWAHIRGSQAVPSVSVWTVIMAFMECGTSGSMIIRVCSVQEATIVPPVMDQ